MFLRVWKHFLATFLIVCSAPAIVSAQSPPVINRGGRNPEGSAAMPGMVSDLNLRISVKGLNGAPIDDIALVTLSTIEGGAYKQATTMGGYAEFQSVTPSRYSIQVVAMGFARAVKETDVEGTGTMTVTFELRSESNNQEGATAPPTLALAPKAQKELGKALEALRTNELAEARTHLETAHRLAPNHPGVNYLYGVYSMMIKDWVQAKSYLAKTLEFSPSHVGALMSLSEVLLHDHSVDEAIPYLNRAAQADQSSWRVHAILANAQMQQGSFQEAIRQVERALELGRGQAAKVKPLLARVLAKTGDIERARSVLQDYLQDHGSDAAAKKQLDSLQSSQRLVSTSEAPPEAGEAKAAAALDVVAALPLTSNWLPANVDEGIPPVEPGVACPLDDVLRKTEERVKEFVGNVDRFTATESVVHETVNQWGMASSPEKRKFEYVVSIREVSRGFFDVDEYRNSGSSPAGFPGRVESRGLPSMILIFHPHSIENFDVTCEGLARWNGRLVWQLYLRQRADKPKTIRSYKLGVNGTSYGVSLKGRAWIAADEYQLVRLETDIIAPLPEIRLVSDHTAIEYGPVHFLKRDTNMWLPQSAEIYFDWRGRRIHRRHSFSNYLLFAVDDKERISAPKSQEDSSPKSPAEASKPIL